MYKKKPATWTVSITYLFVYKRTTTTIMKIDKMNPSINHLGSVFVVM